MKVSKAVAAKNRQKIVTVAAKRYREKGLDGIGVADLMRDAGFTHGGFYGHFSSKEELIAEACQNALQDKVRQWIDVISAHPKSALAAVVEGYLSDRHLNDPGWGCALAALGPEIARQPAPVRRAFTKGFLDLVATLEPVVGGKSKVAKRRKALAAWASLVGAIMLARAVDDRQLSQEIMRAATDAVLKIAS